MELNIATLFETALLSLKQGIMLLVPGGDLTTHCQGFIFYWTVLEGGKVDGGSWVGEEVCGGWEKWLSSMREGMCSPREKWCAVGERRGVSIMRERV